MLKGAACAPARCRAWARAPRCRRKRPSEDGGARRREKESRETGEVGRQRRKRKRKRRRGKGGRTRFVRRRKTGRERACNLRAHHTRVNCSGPLRRGCRERERHVFYRRGLKRRHAFSPRLSRRELARSLRRTRYVECVSHLELSDAFSFHPDESFLLQNKCIRFFIPPYLPSERLLLLFTSFLTFFVVYNVQK